ncbi:MAG: hypothetical protein EBT89_08075 [Opitutaceae bacterium]|nr:hypothetical protein [Opitutaceae bacterium]
MSDKTGGPAFPVTGVHTSNGQAMQHVLDGGMTMLDYFAGEAMQLYPMLHDEAAAKCCYDRAAAMIKEREKRNERTD